MQTRQCMSDETNLMEYVQVIRKHKLCVGAIVIVATAIAIIYSLSATKIYRSEAVIMPISKGRSGGGLSSLLGQAGGGLSSLIGIGGSGAASQNLQFLSLLKTQTLAEDVIKKYDLLPVMLQDYDSTKAGPNDLDSAAKALMSCMSFSEDKRGGTIMIGAEFEDPKVAANLASYYADGLKDFINKNSFTLAKKNRIFVEKQLAQNKYDLLEAGKALNAFYKGEKISNIESQVDVDISVDQPVAEDMGPATAEMQKQLDILNQQKRDIQSKLFVKDIPQQVYLQYLTLQRSILTQVNSMLTQQYEMAKIEESNDEMAFQIIDPARVSLTRVRPQRSKIVIMTFFASFFVGVFVSFAWEYFLRINRDYKKNKIDGGICA